VIALVRVDNRLVHGQVVETWVPRLRVRRILVADDEAARTPLARAAMTLALPEDFPAEVRAVEAVDWAAEAAREDPTLVIFRDLADLARAVARGLTPRLAPAVNLGNLHHRPGRRGVTPSVFLSADEVETVKSLAAAGFQVEARAIPSDVPTGAAEVARRWQAAG
jgi:N-acetylgalactosamine PTS system EIIB component